MHIMALIFFFSISSLVLSLSPGRLFVEEEQPDGIYAVKAQTSL